MADRREYQAARRWQSYLAGLVADQLSLANQALDLLAESKPPTFDGAAVADFKAVDAEVRIQEEFDRMNRELKRVNESRRRP